MIQRVTTVAGGFLLVTLAVGCGCGDRAAYRSITITEMRGVDSGAWGPIEVDTSQVPGIGAVSRSTWMGVEIRFRSYDCFQIGPSGS